MAIENIAQRLPGVFFDIVTPRYNRAWPAVEEDKNTTVYRVGFGSKLDKWLFPILGLLKAYRLTGQYVYKAIHGYQASQASSAAFLLKYLKPRLPFILTLQEGKVLNQQSFLVKFLRRLIVQKADHITVISNYLADYAVQFQKPVTRIPNGVAVDLFVPRDFQNPRKRIITVSRLVNKNGVENLIRAFALLTLSHDLELFIAGDGILKPKLMQLAQELNVSDRIIFAGTVNHNDLPALLAQSDVFVRPSLSEGLGSAFLEAMASGLPVVGTQVGGIPDFLNHGETGLFCDPHRPDDIAQKIELILSDGILRNKIIKQALIHVRENYSWEEIAKRMNEIYTNI